jgi:hypothetical protein
MLSLVLLAAFILPAFVAPFSDPAHAQQTLFVPSCVGSPALDTAKFVELKSIVTGVGASDDPVIKLPYTRNPAQRCTVNNLDLTGITLDNSEGSGISVADGQTLTVGPIQNRPTKRIFYNATAGHGMVVLTDPAPVYPQWWGAKGDDSTESGPQIIAAIAAAVIASAQVSFPAGIYRYATCPNFGFDHLVVQALGNVMLKHTGSGPALRIHQSDSPTPAGIYGLKILGNFIVQGNANTSTDGILIESIHQSVIQLRGRDAPGAMFTVKWCVLTTFDLVCSHTGPGQPFNIVPRAGVVIKGNGGGATQASKFHLQMEGIDRGIGIDVQNASFCTFTGASEDNRIGLRENATSRHNNYIGLDFENNKGPGAVPISAASNANPVSLTSTAHDLATGDRITISGGTGNWAAINGRFTVTRTGTNTFTIPVDSTTFRARTGTVVFEENTDVLLYGSNAVLINILASSNGPNIDAVTAQGTQFIGGSIRSIYLQSGSAETLFQGTQFPDNPVLGITGTGTHRRIGLNKIDDSATVTGTYSDLLRQMFVTQGDPFKITTSRSLTPAELLMRKGLATPPGAGASYTLPTGTDMENAAPPTFNNESFFWSLNNLATGATDTVTIVASANHTFVGNPVIASANAATGGLWGTSQATFFTRKAGTNTWVTYRQ